MLWDTAAADAAPSKSALLPAYSIARPYILLWHRKCVASFIGVKEDRNSFAFCFISRAPQLVTRRPAHHPPCLKKAWWEKPCADNEQTNTKRFLISGQAFCRQLQQMKAKEGMRAGGGGEYCDTVLIEPLSLKRRNICLLCWCWGLFVET